MRFSQNTGIMLYVDDVVVERDFWSAIGFEVFNQSEIMVFETFEMKPSLLFESADLNALHERITSVTETTISINTQPFPHFNFANPNGHYFAVRGI